MEAEVLSLRDAPVFGLSMLDAAVQTSVYEPGRGIVVKQVPEEERKEHVAELTAKVGEIFSIGKAFKRSFIRIGVLLRDIDSGRLYKYACIKSMTFSDIYDFAFKVFGFSRTVTYNMIQVTYVYVDHTKHDYEIDKDYAAFGYSQLVEMLPLDWAWRKKVRPEATVAEIREYCRGVRKYSLLFGDYKDSTFREVLTAIRARDAEKTVTVKAEKRTEEVRGLLSLLTSAEPEEEQAAEAVIAPVISEAPKGEPEKGKLELSNKKAREEWLLHVFDGAKPWRAIPELDLEFYRYEFANGAVLIRIKGVSYWDAWSKDPGRESTVAWYFIMDEGHPKFAIDAHKSVNQAVDWMTGHGNEI